MNWTGGSLQRTKNANRGVRQKQKAFFARARTKLQNDSNSHCAPSHPSFLRKNDPVTSARTPWLGLGAMRHTSQPARCEREAIRQSSGDGNTVFGDQLRPNLDRNIPLVPYHHSSCKTPAKRELKGKTREPHDTSPLNGAEKTSVD